MNRRCRLETGGKQFRVRFLQPSHGWLGLEIGVQGNELKEAVSHTPNDFVCELVAALLLAVQESEGVAAAHCEPAAYELKFTPLPCLGLIDFQITKYPNWNRNRRSGTAVLSLQDSTINIVLPFWRALRNLQGLVPEAEYQEAMRKGFPSTSLQRLSELVGEQRIQ